MSTEEMAPELGEAEGAPHGESLLETIVGVLAQPVPTLRRVTHQPRVAWALIVTALIALASSVAGVGRYAEIGRFGDFRSEAAPELRAFLIAVAIIVWPLLAVSFLAVWAGILQGASRLLGGTGAYTGTLSGLGFAGVPYLLSIPAQVLPVALGAAAAVLSGLIQFALLIWVFVLDVIAIRESHGFSTGRAVATVLIPFAVLVALFVVLILVLAAVIAANVGS